MTESFYVVRGDHSEAVPRCPYQEKSYTHVGNRPTDRIFCLCYTRGESLTDIDVTRHVMYIKASRCLVTERRYDEGQMFFCVRLKDVVSVE
jgi:hypothetical protein